MRRTPFANMQKKTANSLYFQLSLYELFFYGTTVAKFIFSIFPKMRNTDTLKWQSYEI